MPEFYKDNNPDPLFPCGHQGCAESVSYHADMLAMRPGGGVICWDCWGEERAEGQPHWNDLPAFVPQPKTSVSSTQENK